MKKFFFILLLVAGGWAVHTYDRSTRAQIDASSIKQLVVEGDKALNIGRYADAKRIFEEELKINPQNLQAAWGLKIAGVKETLSGEAYKQAVDDLYKQNPKDGHVNLFLGEFYADNQELDKAITYYESAIKLDPELSEAHYDLAVLYEQQGDLNAAKVEYLKALSLSPESRYQNSLATIYFKQQQYESAVKEYGKNLEYPLSSLESAKIFWRLGYLSQALKYQKQAIELLENEVVMTKSDNQESWYIDIAQEHAVKLATLGEKKSYGYLSLSATLFLQGNAMEAENAVQKVRNLKLRNQADINLILKTNLDTFMQGNAEVSGLVEDFKKLYL